MLVLGHRGPSAASSAASSPQPRQHPPRRRAVRQSDRNRQVTQEAHARVLSVIVCGAGPATAIGTFVGLAQERGWTVQVIATPAAVDFFDQAVIEKATGRPLSTAITASQARPAPRFPMRSLAPRPATKRSTSRHWASATPTPRVCSPRPPAWTSRLWSCHSSTPRWPAASPSAAAPKPSRRRRPHPARPPADSSPESRRVRTYREQGGVRPRPSAPGASLGLVDDPGRAADRLSGVTAAVDRLAGGALERGGFLTAVIPDKAGG